MKARVLFCTFACVVFAVPAICGDVGERHHTWCQVGGSWFALAGGAPWIATFSETSIFGGTLITQWTGGDGDWGGSCPGSVRYTNGFGSWTRKGPHALLYTIVTFSLDANGDVACIWKMSGWVTLDLGCDSGVQNGSLELFDPESDPFTDEPFNWYPPDGETPFVRMTVDPIRE